MCYLFIYFYLYLTRRFTKKPSQDSSHDANMLKMHQLQQKIQDLQQFIQNTNTHNKTHQRPHKKNIHISFTVLLMMLFNSAAGMLNVFKLRSFCFSEELTRAEKSMEVNGAVLFRVPASVIFITQLFTFIQNSVNTSCLHRADPHQHHPPSHERLKSQCSHTLWSELMNFHLGLLDFRRGLE